MTLDNYFHVPVRVLTGATGHGGGGEDVLCLEPYAFRILSTQYPVLSTSAPPEGFPIC